MFMCRVIAISGSPGVGKSTIARIVSRVLNTDAIDLSELVISKHLYSGYDVERKSYVIDEDLVKKELREIILRCGKDKRYLVVEGHYAEIVDDDDLEVLFVLRIDPRELVKRLCIRGWGFRKSLENGEAEYLGICLHNALEKHHVEKICEIDVTNTPPDLAAKKIIDLIGGRDKCGFGIDWAETIDPGEIWETATRYCHQDLQAGDGYE